MYLSSHHILMRPSTKHVLCSVRKDAFDDLLQRIPTGICCSVVFALNSAAPLMLTLDTMLCFLSFSMSPSFFFPI